MSGFLGVIDRCNIKDHNYDYLTSTIDLYQNFEVTLSIQDNSTFFAASSYKDRPLKGKRLFENREWVILFAGDIIENEAIPYDNIIRNLEIENFNYFKNLEGIFSISAYNKKDKRIYLVSDRLSQQPVFYFLHDDGVCFSTEMATFCRLNKGIEFNKEWLWEFLYFNFPIGDSTFLKGVKRMPPASIFIYEVDRKDFSVFEYCSMFKKEQKLLDGKKALECASDIFSKRIPHYFKTDGKILCALTGGWDCRTLIALAPEEDITTYTYGVPGCGDLSGGTESAKKLGIKHIEIYFDNKFVKDLNHLMLETVFLSSGLERVVRATLLYVYRKLSHLAETNPLIISGILFDTQFRGHAGRIDVTSSDMVNLFEGKKTGFRKAFWSSIVSKDYHSFEKHINNKLNELKSEFGDFSDTKHHLSYISYMLSSKYFCGEMGIAKYFCTLRAPCLDRKIIGLAHSIKQSTLSFSEFTDHVRGSRDEMVMQAYLLSNLAPHFAKIPVGNTRPDIVLKGEIVYQLYRVYKGVIRRIKNLFLRETAPAPLENWELWLNHFQKEFVNDLIFSGDSRIREYVNDEYLYKLEKDREVHYIGKLVTVEIILRLIENNWERYWQSI